MEAIMVLLWGMVGVQGIFLVWALVLLSRAEDREQDDEN